MKLFTKLLVALGGLAAYAASGACWIGWAEEDPMPESLIN